jgi:hypothetical protein
MGKEESRVMQYDTDNNAEVASRKLYSEENCIASELLVIAESSQ